ncbi:MAG: hypothetical protein ACOC2M_02090, partial [bacterium]
CKFSCCKIYAELCKITQNKKDQNNNFFTSALLSFYKKLRAKVIKQRCIYGIIFLWLLAVIDKHKCQMNKIITGQKNKALIEKFRQNFKSLKEENRDMTEERNELILRIQQKTGKTKEEILTEINRFIK